MDAWTSLVHLDTANLKTPATVMANVIQTVSTVNLQPWQQSG